MGISISKIWNIETHNETANVDSESLYYREMRKARAEMDAWERVKAVFETDLYGEITPELARIKDSVMISSVLGFAVGGFSKGKTAMDAWLRQNAHEKFETPQHAQKALSDKVMLGFGNGAFRLAWRLSLFTFLYMMGTTLVAAYRDYHGVAEHVVGGGLAGFLYKFKQGPKPCISGLVIGSGLGLTAGGVTLIGAKLLGTTPNEFVEFHYRNIQDRKRAEMAVRTNARFKNEDEDLVKFHERYMATDDLSLSKAKGSDIHTIAEGVRKNKIPVSEDLFEVIMPAAVREAVEEVRQAAATSPVPSTDTKTSNATASVSQAVPVATPSSNNNDSLAQEQKKLS